MYFMHQNGIRIILIGSVVFRPIAQNVLFPDRNKGNQLAPYLCPLESCVYEFS